MRIALLLVMMLFCCSAQAWGWAENNCQIFYKAYVLENASQAAASAPSSNSAKKSRTSKKSSGKGAATSFPSKTLLIAFTIVPPANSYLYGSESKEGLPTRMEAFFAPLAAYPMDRLSDKEIDRLLEKRGLPLALREPLAPLKKDTVFASVVLPGNADSNPPIYPGAVTFWAELPVSLSPLGGLLIQARLSGLLCSASSCMPASGTLRLDLTSSAIGELPVAEQQSWWASWEKGEAVLIAPPENAQPLVGSSSFSGGKPLSLGSAMPLPGASLDGNEEGAGYTALLASLAPKPFNPALEVQFLGEAILLGLAAGLLLNLMPCVLPVISLKFSALMAVSTMTDKRRQAKAFKRHCLIFAAGILTWFFILSLLLGVAGWAWGELFQQPFVILGLGMILFMLGLSLFGVFSLPLFDLKVTSEQHPHWHAFASGLLATLLATPCSGPLLGGVLAWAIRQPLPALASTVISIGVGMALPYFILACYPRLVHLLPRPGAWTIRLEQILGFFLMGSVVYLATLLPIQWMPAFLCNLFAVALASWLWGQVGHLRASRLQRGLCRTGAFVVVALAVWWGSVSVYPDASWEPFDPAQFSESLGKEALLLEFTADWCPSCKALEHTTLNKNRMASLRKKYNVRTIRVDLTRDSDEAGRAGKELLKALDSTSIPVLALFPKGESSKSPVVLRDLVTPKQLHEAASSAY